VSSQKNKNYIFRIKFKDNNEMTIFSERLTRWFLKLSKIDDYDKCTIFNTLGIKEMERVDF